MRKIILLTIALACFAFNSQAMPFNEVWRLATAENPNIKATLNAYNAQIEEAKQIRAALLPYVVFDASWMKNESDAVFKGSTRTKYSENYNTSSYTFRFVQPIFHFESFLHYREAKKYPEIGKILILKNNHEFFGLVLEAYVSVLFNKEYLNVVNSKKESIYEQMSSLQKRFELGDATVTDLAEIKARYDLTLSEEIAVKNAYLSSMKLLAIYANMPESELDADEFDPTLTSSFDLHSLNYWIEKAIESNTDIRYKKIELEIADMMINKEKSKIMPKIDFTASYTDKNDDGDTNGVGEDSQVTSFGINVQFPLLQGGRTVAGIREKTHLKYKNLNELLQIKLDISSVISELFFNISSSKSRIDAFETALKSAKIAVEYNEKGFKIGTRTNMDLLDAKEQYFKVKKDFYQIKLSYILSYYNLLTVAGLLDEENIELLR